MKQMKNANECWGQMEHIIYADGPKRFDANQTNNAPINLFKGNSIVTTLFGMDFQFQPPKFMPSTIARDDNDTQKDKDFCPIW